MAFYQSWKLHGQESSVDPHIEKAGCEMLKGIHEKWELYQIYNANETRLFFCQPPNQTMAFSKRS
ncbi:hypothetical protein HK096_011313, partial [Nowakowskiella sp. JEL0078]